MAHPELMKGVDLLKRLIVPAEDGQGLRGSEPPNRGMAIFVSFVAAFLLWFTVSMRGSYPLTIDLATEVVNVPTGRALEELPPNKVRVQVQGEGWQLLRLYTNRELIPIDASATAFNLSEAVAMELPRDLQVQNVSPEQCDIRLGERVRRKIPVRFRGRIEPAPTHDTTSAIRLQPDSVVVEGAAAVIRPLRYWPTEPLRRSNIRGVFTARVSLADSLAGLVELSTEAVTLIANIEQFTEVELDVAVRITGLPAGLQEVSLIPDRVSVIFRVPLSQAGLAEAPNADIWAYVPYQEIATDSLGAVSPRLSTPDGLSVRNVQFTPAQLRYYLVVD